jgi:hypothetical protein
MTQSQQTIQPQPTPESWTIQIATGSDGSKMVMISIFSVTGTHCSFISPEIAEQLGQQLHNASKQAGSGIILPGPGFQLPVNGQGLNGHSGG